MRIERSRIERWLREDLGCHDITNDVPGETNGRLITTTAGVIAGLDAATELFNHLGCSVDLRRSSGERVEAGETLFRVSGPASAVLRGERVALNVAGHASGIATRTRTAVDAAHRVSDSVTVAGTRKTTPGLRGIEKRAIAAGGGDTHRLDCSHMVMIKDNHIAVLGVERAVERFRERSSFATSVEVEAETTEVAVAAADAGADVVLLDNMTPAETEAAVEALPEGVLTEASGGITVEDVPSYAETGVDVVSLGSITHSAPALDLSFRIDG
ncbi:carboxylating nicotinate-nucleotide diphosphorylase [Natronomonas sp. LN261]|uniref:carboxylating nicotinate-nucleotide diphosphorylase n=1 Tax=Natronomonas sp. LN261 TaxID=2750669 RepID=UPI0015EE86D8|nr:carboxylating nicotinate-nucleotide diphosphorylase [Natronomonas sp. LN261]